MFYRGLKVTPKSLLFNVHLWQVHVNIQPFHSLTFQPLKCLLPEEIRFERGLNFDFRGHHFKTVLGSEALFILRHSKRLSTLLSSLLSFLEFGASLIQVKVKSSYNPDW